MKICAFITAMILVLSCGLTGSAMGADSAYAVLGSGYTQSNNVIVEITSPASGSVVYYNHRITVEAAVEATDTVDMVEFYKDNETEPFATDTTAPYTGVITCGADDFTVKAKAYTSGGFYNFSDESQVTVDPEAGYVETTYVDADFDGSTATPQNISLDAKGQVSTIVSTPADASGNTRSGNSAYIQQATTSGNPWMDYYNADKPLSGTIVVETGVMLETLPAYNLNWFQFFTDGTTTNPGNLCEFNSAGSLNTYYDNNGASARNTLIPNGSVQALKWYDLKFVINFDNLTYTAELNGINYGGVKKLQNSQNPTNAAAYKEVTRLRTRLGGAGSGMYMDYLRIYTKPFASENITFANANFDSSTTAPANFTLDRQTTGTASILASPKDYLETSKAGNSVYLASADASKHPMAYYQDTANPMKGIITIEANVMPAAAAYPGAVELFYFANSAGNLGRLAKFENSNITNWNGGSRLDVVVTNFQQGKWYHFKYIINTYKSTYDLVIDNSITRNNIPIVPEGGRTLETGITRWQFRVAGNATNPNNGIYVDDWKITALPAPQVYGAVFTSDGGVLSVNKNRAPRDLRSIAVDFADNMNGESFNGVTLTNADTEQSVSFTGNYNSATKQYIVTPLTALDEKTEYNLTFPATVEDAAGSRFAAAEVITFTTDALDIKVESVSFFGNDGLPLNKAATGGKVKAVVSAKCNAEYPVTFCIAIAKYDNNQLIKCALNLLPSLDPGESDSFEVELTGLDNDISGSEIKVFIWKNLEQLWPVSKPVSAE